MTTYTIPNLQMPGPILPATHTPLADFLRYNQAETSILTILATQNHPTRLALLSGDLKADLFNHRTANCSPIAREEWAGDGRWNSLQLDTVVEGGDVHTILLDLATSPQLAEPVTLLMAQIDAVPDFPKKLRRLIELYYELGVHQERPSTKALEKKLKDRQWDPTSASSGTIPPSYAKWLLLFTAD